MCVRMLCSKFVESRTQWVYATVMQHRELSTQMKLKFHARPNSRMHGIRSYVALYAFLWSASLSLSPCLSGSAAVARIDGQVIIVAVTSDDAIYPSIRSIRPFNSQSFREMVKCDCVPRSRSDACACDEIDHDTGCVSAYNYIAFKFENDIKAVTYARAFQSLLRPMIFDNDNDCAFGPFPLQISCDRCQSFGHRAIRNRSFCAFMTLIAAQIAPFDLDCGRVWRRQICCAWKSKKHDNASKMAPTRHKHTHTHDGMPLVSDIRLRTSN